MKNSFRETTFQTFLCLFVIRKIDQRKTLSNQRKIWLGFQESIFLEKLEGKHFPEVVKKLEMSYYLLIISNLILKILIAIYIYIYIYILFWIFVFQFHPLEFNFILILVFIFIIVICFFLIIFYLKFFIYQIWSSFFWLLLILFKIIYEMLIIIILISSSFNFFIF